MIYCSHKYSACYLCRLWSSDESLEEFGSCRLCFGAKLPLGNSLIRPGNKVSQTRSLHCPISGGLSLGNPYDGETLAEQLEQVEILSGKKPRTTIVDLVYRGRSLDGVEILRRCKPKRLTRSQWSWVKRRQAIEPVIEHFKDDCRLRRNRLKGALGNALHVVSCAARYNPGWLLRWIVLFSASVLSLFTGTFGLESREIGMQVARKRNVQERLGVG